MNGAIIPAVLYYLVSFQPSVPAEPLAWMGPLSRADCMQFERQTSGTWCQPIRLRRDHDVRMKP
jgi:hypothetical protein